MTISVKDGGVWKTPLLTQVKHEGAWVTPVATYVKDNGVWKLVGDLVELTDPIVTQISNTTGTTIPFPADIQAGDLLFLSQCFWAIATQGSTNGYGTGFTGISTTTATYTTGSSNQIRLSLSFKIADGTESGNLGGLIAPNGTPVGRSAQLVRYRPTAPLSAVTPVPQSQNIPFTQSFPGSLAYAVTTGVETPTWSGGVRDTASDLKPLTDAMRMATSLTRDRQQDIAVGTIATNGRNTAYGWLELA